MWAGVDDRKYDDDKQDESEGGGISNLERVMGRRYSDDANSSSVYVHLFGIGLVHLLLYQHTHHDANNDQNDECDDEANPSLLAGCACRLHRFRCLRQSNLSVLFDSGSLCFDNVDSIVLLFYKHTHIVEKLGQFPKRLLYSLDVLMPFLDFPVRHS